MSVDCTSKVEADPDARQLHVADVREWLDNLPNGATLHAITRDFGNQRDPEVHLTGLRATWSESR